MGVVSGCDTMLWLVTPCLVVTCVETANRLSGLGSICGMLSQSVGSISPGVTLSISKFDAHTLCDALNGIRVHSEWCVCSVSIKAVNKSLPCSFMKGFG